MRDAVDLEKRGIPTVTFVYEPFKGVAERQAAMLGMPNLALEVLEYKEVARNYGMTPEERARMIDAHMEPTIVKLTNPPGKQAHAATPH